jgi:hypothetical protein
MLSSIADWNSFNTIAAKIVVCIAGILAILSSVYLVMGQTREHGKN